MAVAVPKWKRTCIDTFNALDKDDKDQFFVTIKDKRVPAPCPQGSNSNVTWSLPQNMATA